MNPLLLDQGVACIPWSPLARGRLARAADPSDRSTKRSEKDPHTESLYERANLAVLQRVAEVAQERGVRPAQVATAWLLHQPVVTAPIVGATKIEQLDDPIAAVDLELSEDELARLAEPYIPQPVSGHQ